MVDMRDALTAEVAEKHDTILNLRRDLQQLEEQCQQTEKQTLFKDDIIKELRKELKQLKQVRMHAFKMLLLTPLLTSLKNARNPVMLKIMNPAVQLIVLQIFLTKIPLCKL